MEVASFKMTRQNHNHVIKPKNISQSVSPQLFTPYQINFVRIVQSPGNFHAIFEKGILLISLFRYSLIAFNFTLLGTVFDRNFILSTVKFNTKHLVLQLLQQPQSFSIHLHHKSTFVNPSLNRGCLEQGSRNISLIFW